MEATGWALQLLRRSFQHEPPMMIRGGGDPMPLHGLDAEGENGPATRSFAADA